VFNTVGNSIKKLPPRSFISLGLAGAALGIAVAVWLSNGSDGLANECEPNPGAQSALNEMAVGPMGALHATATGRGYTDLAFVDERGNPVTLANFAVITIGLEMGDDGIEKERQFLAEFNLPNLPLYADPTFKAFERLKNSGVSLGLPTTLLLDAGGCELAVLQGLAPWASQEGSAVVEKLIELHRQSA